jgi:hypothetical protein
MAIISSRLGDAALPGSSIEGLVGWLVGWLGGWDEVQSLVLGFRFRFRFGVRVRVLVLV